MTEVRGRTGEEIEELWDCELRCEVYTIRHVWLGGVWEATASTAMETDTDTVDVGWRDASDETSGGVYVEIGE